MLPDNVLSTEVVQGIYLFPDNIVGTPLEDYELGGVAIQDPSQGLQVQPWYGYWSALDNTAYLRANFTGSPIALFTESDVVEFSFTFDQSMRWVAATLSSTGVLKFRWFDASVPGYVMTTYSNVFSMKLCLDDKRRAQLAADKSDILLTYITTSQELYFRAQRERYLVAHLLSSTIQPNVSITNFGMCKNYRVQWRLQNIVRI